MNPFSPFFVCLTLGALCWAVVFILTLDRMRSERRKGPTTWEVTGRLLGRHVTSYCTSREDAERERRYMLGKGYRRVRIIRGR